MTVVEVRKDAESRSMSIVAEYPVSTARVWRLWADPRQLERWWGPPGYPATVTHHDLSAGGLVVYHMTTPEGERHHGGWRVRRAEPPSRLEVEAYFADEDGNESTELPRGTMVVAIDEAGAGASRMTITSTWASEDDMRTALEMGMEEGMRAGMGQIDALLAEHPG
jgi:uncharacterized protein YndB with AHSA1/START domain